MAPFLNHSQGFKPNTHKTKLPCGSDTASSEPFHDLVLKKPDPRANEASSLFQIQHHVPVGTRVVTYFQLIQRQKESLFSWED